MSPIDEERGSVTGHRRWERVAPALLGALWLASFLLTLNAIFAGRTYNPLYVAGAGTEEGYPVVTGFPPYVRGAQSGLEVGDRLLELDGVDLRGVGAASFFALYFEVAGSRVELPIVYQRGGTKVEETLITAKAPATAYILALSVVWVAAALHLRLRFPPTGMVRAFFYGFAWQGLYFASNFFGSRWETWGAVAMHGLCMTLLPALMVRAFQRFPHDRRPETATARALPWLFVPLGVLHLSRFGFPIPPAIGVPAVTLGTLLLLLTVLGIVTRVFRREDPVGRRKLKWFLWGHYCALLPPAAGAMAAAIEPDLTNVFFASLVTLSLVPISLILSITRFNIADIDRVISVTASYNVLIAVALVGGIMLGPLLSYQVVALAGVHPAASRALVSLVLAAVVLPLHTRLRPRIEHQFFAARYALDQGVSRLSRELSEHGDTSGLVRVLGTRLAELYRPEACVIYGRDPNGYSAVFVDGRTIPPILDARGPLIATLRHRGRPLALATEGAGRRPAEELSPFDRAALDTLDAAILIPITAGDELALLICLGRRLSGDVYTPTDVGLLATLGDKASAELEKLGQVELLRQSRAMQDALRRYVPSAVVPTLAEGEDPPSTRRDVTVLFVDIRGYTSLAQDGVDEEIFATINRYTETVSASVARYGGHVVEFNGDGLMAVFGAPGALLNKERSAVLAAREILESVGSLPQPPPRAPLSVGVGVASGPALVGNIRSADRLVWSVIGNTTNRAARLQGLSRDLDASIVVDAETRNCAGYVCSDFELRPGVALRGRSAPEDLWTLALAARAV